MANKEEFQYIDTKSGLAEVVSSLLDTSRMAIDTEFHRERTYYPKVALVQIQWDDRLVLIDPLGVDLQALAPVFEGEGLVVMHAASQDLEVFDRACGIVPSRLADTQIAAGFIGLRTPSLAGLHEHFLQVSLAKGDRLTDWLKRPLNDNQLNYAASDVARLLEIHDLIGEQLVARGRQEWVEAEYDELVRKASTVRDPLECWRRIKEARHLKAQPLAVVQAVAAWRELRARERDLPARFVLSDMAVVSVSQKAPRSASDLKGLRGLDERQLRGSVGDSLLEAVAAGRDNDPPTREKPRNNRDQAALRPAASLLAAWLSQHATDLDIDPALLGTRNDIECVLRDEPCRLSTGWRAAMAGDPIKQLIAGDAALAFERGGGLTLEQRSRVPFVVNLPGESGLD